MPPQSPSAPQSPPAQQSPSDSEPRPLLSVVRGEPTTDELAAVTIVLAAMAHRSAQPAASAGRPSSAWSAREQMLRPPVFAGPGAWRASGRGR